MDQELQRRNAGGAGGKKAPVKVRERRWESQGKGAGLRAGTRDGRGLGQELAEATRSP